MMIKKTSTLCLTMIFITICCSSVNSEKKNHKVSSAEHIDILKYLGTWYEIAKIPNRFQKKCSSSVKAEYTLKNKKKMRIRVVNSCISHKGKLKRVEGEAKIVDKKSFSKLKVSFFRPFGINLFWGNYWILGIIDDYKVAVVGTPDRKYGWILARTKTISEEQLNKAFKILSENGYKKDLFKFTIQK